MPPRKPAPPARRRPQPRPNKPLPRASTAPARAIGPPLVVAWLLPLAWVAFRALTHTLEAADMIAAALAAALLLARLAWLATRPKQRVATWRKPRGIDAIRRR